jgi:hypothetical protein
MEYTSKMPESYWLTEFNRDIDNLNKKIDLYKGLIEFENKQPNQRYGKLIYWGDEIKQLNKLIESRKKAIDKINNK